MKNLVVLNLAPSNMVKMFEHDGEYEGSKCPK